MNSSFKVTSTEVTMSDGKSYPIGRSKKDDLLLFMLENQGGN